MSDGYDVVVVGGRCAGSTVAAHLARAGLSVALVERAEFPSDTLSTHFFQTPGIDALDRLGVLGEVMALGAPFVPDVDYRLDDLAGVSPYGPGRMALSVRRTALDAILVRAAEDAGARLMTGTRVIGLVEDGGRVTGVSVVDRAGRDVRLCATLVVGADGTGSTVARLAGARCYHVLPNQRFIYWGYFEGTTVPERPAVLFHRFGEELTIGFPCDAGLYVAIVMPPIDRLPAFAENLDGAFAGSIAADEGLVRVLDGAGRVGPLRGMARFPLFFRESDGPGWVLVGDAGHFKDPTPGLGMSDAFRQAERLAADVIAALGGDGGTLDEALARWWAWRDDDSLEMHWCAADFGAAGPAPVILTEALRAMADEPNGLTPFWDLFQHRSRPSEVLTADRLTAAAGRLAGTPLGLQAQSELAAMDGVAVERAALAEHPVFEDSRTARRAAMHVRPSEPVQTP